MNKRIRKKRIKQELYKLYKSKDDIVFIRTSEGLALCNVSKVEVENRLQDYDGDIRCYNGYKNNWFVGFYCKEYTFIPIDETRCTSSMINEGLCNKLRCSYTDMQYNERERMRQISRRFDNIYY